MDGQMIETELWKEDPMAEMVDDGGHPSLH